VADAPLRSVCVRCGEDKELPLARCAGCGHVPTRGEAALAVLASTRMLEPTELDEVQRRIRRGEPLRPSAARLAAASALVRDQPASGPRTLTAAEEAGLTALCVLVTPIPALAAAWAWRDTPAARAALRVAAITLVVDAALMIAAMTMGVGAMPGSR